MVAELPETTDLIDQWQAGSNEAFQQLIERVYENLEKLARKHLHKEFRGSKLQTTELISEVCIKLMKQPRMEITNRTHFLNLVSQTLYRLLVDLARNRHSKKQGGEFVHLEIGGQQVGWSIDPVTLMAVHEALEQMKEEDPILVELVKLRVFAGFTIVEVSEILDMSISQVNRKYSFARVLLKRMLKDINFRL